MTSDNNASGNTGTIIEWNSDGEPRVPEMPIISFIEGDGIGPEIWAESRAVFDVAVKTAYGGKRKVFWRELLAGEKAEKALGPGNRLPADTIREIAHYGVAIKGPLSTPVAGGHRSLNVALRRELDLYACVRPVRYIQNVPTPFIYADRVDMVIFRENTEDVYTGIEWEAGSEQARAVINHINEMLDPGSESTLSPETAIGIKPMSKFKTSRLVRKAIQYALGNGYKSVTLVHKGNIMKFTEGAFRDWGYEVAQEEFPEQTITEAELLEIHDGNLPPGKIVIKDRIADAMFQDQLLRPEQYDVIATPNLNGDYLSDAAAALVGGLGLAPGCNIGDRCALFEATHGTAPDIAGLDKANPSSQILSGVEMLHFLGWPEAAHLIFNALKQAFAEGIMTVDLAGQVENVKPVKCSEFGAAIQNMIPSLAGI
ncbi:MAG: NADP-dependent isocitrate dehydrogenase [Planctomycetota bacterium]|jgi:isocitrate dehydrogenase